MKFDGLIGAFVIMGIDVGAFCFNLAALSYVSPYTGGANDLCDLAPIPTLCNYAQEAITAPWILFMRPDCIGTRMATCVMHFTVFFMFHAFCIATDAHAVVATASNASLERRRYWHFICGAMANGFLYYESVAVGVQAHRAAVVLFDFSCVTPNAEMPVIDLSIFWLWDQSNLEMTLFISAVTFPLVVAFLLFAFIPRDLPNNQLAVVHFLARIHAVPADYPLKWLREWLVCTNDLAKKKKKGRKTNQKPD